MEIFIALSSVTEVKKIAAQLITMKKKGSKIAAKEFELANKMKELDKDDPKWQAMEKESRADAVNLTKLKKNIGSLERKKRALLPKLSRADRVKLLTDRVI